MTESNCSKCRLDWFSFWNIPFITAIIIVVSDQLTKWAIVKNVELYTEKIPVIEGFFNIVYTRNTGAAWGIFSDHTWLLALFSFVTGCLLVAFYRKLTEDRLIQAIGLSLIIGGTFGNLIDRAFLNYVIDFLDFYHKDYHFPAFNVADSAISIGVGLFIIASLLAPSTKETTEEKKPETAQK